MKNKVNFLKNVIGHEEVKEALHKFNYSEKLPSSLIFYGLEGIGKFYTALKFSENLLTTKPPSEVNLFGETIENNTEENKETLPDLKIVYPDDKDSIKIDKIREVANFFSLSPSKSKYRIVIIKDADTMTNQASNSILKILEEPNKNCILILTYNNLKATLETIKSRCIKIKFNQPNFENYSKILKELEIKSNKEIYLNTQGSIKKTIEFSKNNIDDLADKYLSLLLNNSLKINDILKYSEKLKDIKRKNIIEDFLEKIIFLLLLKYKETKNQKFLKKSDELILFIKKTNFKNLDYLDILKSINNIFLL
jgi:DNA polymerase-3 subunit delta'